MSTVTTSGCYPVGTGVAGGVDVGGVVGVGRGVVDEGGAVGAGRDESIGRASSSITSSS
ncbi:MAG: hypothetical protein JNM74_24050 [Myxococcales bacterium]|nr:hypothetical protein [Myxococcales bacterium]